MNDYIDIYCERISPGLLAEPINAVTNIAFFVAAYLSIRLIIKQQAFDIGFYTLVALLTAIGIGSSLFHTFATSWAALSDVLPILLFQLYFLWLYLRKVVDLNIQFSLLLLMIFFGLIQLSSLRPSSLNGSVGYLPAIFALSLLAIYQIRNCQRDKYSLLIASLIFCASLFLRTIDMAVCPSFPLGSHFMWHILNAGVLYFSIKGLVLNSKYQVRTDEQL